MVAVGAALVSTSEVETESDRPSSSVTVSVTV